LQRAQSLPPGSVRKAITGLGSQSREWIFNPQAVLKNLAFQYILAAQNLAARKQRSSNNLSVINRIARFPGNRSGPFMNIQADIMNRTQPTCLSA
jgi:hypothetical protein